MPLQVCRIRSANGVEVVQYAGLTVECPSPETRRPVPLWVQRRRRRGDTARLWFVGGPVSPDAPVTLRPLTVAAVAAAVELSRLLKEAGYTRLALDLDGRSP